MASASRALRRWLRLGFYAAALLTTFSAVSAALHSCDSHSGDALLQRVESHLSQCLPSQSAALDSFKDALNANELEAQAPLALVGFSSSSTQLTRLAVAVATAVADVSPAVRVLDFSELLSQERPNHELRQALRSEMAATLHACPKQRTLFVVRGLEAVARDRLPLLDVFLDPMNGARALLHDHATGRDVDCRRALFLFLYRQNHGDSALTRGTWRDFLVAKWKAHAQDEAFTPQALVGRLTVAVQLQAESEEPVDGLCDWDDFLARLGVARRHAEEAAARVEETTAKTEAKTGGVAPLGESPWSAAQPASVFGALLVFVAVLVAAKRFVASSKEMEEVVLIQQAKRQSSSSTSRAKNDEKTLKDAKEEAKNEKKKDEEEEEDESSRAYSLRSRTVVAATHTETHETAVSSPHTQPAAAKSPPPHKQKAGKRPASARSAGSQTPQATGVVAPPPTPANAPSVQAPTAGMKSPRKRNTRRATHSGSR